MPTHLVHSDTASGVYDHIYLSPHLDDAVLSCGGAIARHVAHGQRVLVVTACTAIPTPTMRFSSFAQETHAKWQLSAEQAVEARLQEDLAALNCVGADNYWLEMLDAIYRQPEWYRDDATLFGSIAPGDTLLADLVASLAALAERFPAAMFYAPLGVGHHVDHQIMYAAALDLARHGRAVLFYEDYPYVAQAGQLAQRLEELGGAASFVSSTLDIDATLARKISAIEAYASQIEALFGGPVQMGQAVTAYAEGLRPESGTYGERLWLLKN